MLVLGANGGVGHAALQLAWLMGARVLAVASGADGVALARRLGADAVVDGREGDVVAAAREFAPDGVDAALLTAGGDVARLVLSTLREGGRAAYPHGVEPEPRPVDVAFAMVPVAPGAGGEEAEKEVLSLRLPPPAPSPSSSLNSRRSLGWQRLPPTCVTPVMTLGCVCYHTLPL